MTSNVIKLTIKTKVDKKRKIVAKTSRQQLLDTLRAECKRREGTKYSLSENTLLIELAKDAARSSKRSITWYGIRFPLRNGIWITVLDPETGKPLISAPGGLL